MPLGPTLIDFTRRYCINRRACPDYARTIQKRAMAFAAHVGDATLAGVLREDRLNSFLATLSGSPWTINKYRGDLLAVWRAAADEDLVPYPIARRVYRQRQPELLVECYSEDEARALVEFAATLKGGLPNGVARRHYWPAAIRVGWESGQRRGDVWRLKRAAIRKDGCWPLVQNKTGRLVVCRLRPSTLDALTQAGGALAWPMRGTAFSRHFREIVDGSGVGRGTYKFLRRASGSYVELLQAGAGHKHLGNTAAVFEKHYDSKLGQEFLPMPPEL